MQEWYAGSHETIDVYRMEAGRRRLKGYKTKENKVETLACPFL